MNESLMLITCYIAGMALGGMFFGGLWWTIKKALASSRPAVWFLASLLLRMSVTLGGFFAISAGHWQRMVVCVFGFLTSRLLITWLTKPADALSGPSIEEVGNAH